MLIFNTEAILLMIMFISLIIMSAYSGYQTVKLKKFYKFRSHDEKMLILCSFLTVTIANLIGIIFLLLIGYCTNKKLLSIKLELPFIKKGYVFIFVSILIINKLYVNDIQKKLKKEYPCDHG